MKFFGYTLIPCEMGSEGHSSWADFGVYEGETILDVVKDYFRKTVDCEDLPNDKTLKENIHKGSSSNEFTYYHDYFTTYFTAMPSNDVYGHVNMVDVIIR